MQKGLIKRIREQRGWTQMDLCQKTGLSYNTVAFAERGTICTPRTAESLSKALGVVVKPVVNERTPRVLKRRIKYKRRNDKAKAKREAQKKLQEALSKAMDAFNEDRPIVAEDIVVTFEREDDDGQTHCVEEVENGLAAGESEPHQDTSGPETVGSGEQREADPGVQSPDEVPSV